MSRRLTVATGLLLTLGVAALDREFYRHAGALWRDEVNSVNVASLGSLWAVVSNAHLDSFPMAWVIVLYAWVRAGFGGSDAEIRRVGFAIGLALLPVLWWSARRLRVTAPLVSLVIFAMSPTTIVYAGEVRGYGLGALAIVWCMGALWSFVEHPTWGRGVLAAGASVLAAQTYFGNCFLLVALVLAAAATAVRHRDTRRAAAVLAIGLLAASSMVVNVPSVRYAARLSPIETSSYGLAWFANVFWGALGPGISTLQWLWPASAAAGTLGIALAWRSNGPPSSTLDDADQARFVTIAAVLGVGGYYAFAKYIGVQTNYWYYLPLMAVLALACEVGVALAAARLPAGDALRIAAAGLAAILVARDVAATVRVRMTNLDVVADIVSGAARPDDFVVVAPWYMGITFARYYRGPAPWATLPDFADHRFHLHAELIERMREGDGGITPVLTRVEATLRRGHRVWTVGPLLAPPPGAPPVHLPPWPDGPEGRLNAPYVEGWARQLGAMLRDHGADVRSVQLPDLGRVNRWEEQPLEYVEGWR